MSYTDYWDFFDNGPETQKRRLRRQLRAFNQSMYYKMLSDDSMNRKKKRSQVEMSNTCSKGCDRPAEYCTHCYHEYKAETAGLQTALRLAVGVISDLLNGGNHDGECTEESVTHGEACEIHIATAEARQDNARRLVLTIEKAFKLS